MTLDGLKPRNLSASATMPKCLSNEDGEVVHDVWDEGPSFVSDGEVVSMVFGMKAIFHLRFVTVTRTVSKAILASVYFQLYTN